MDQLKNLNSETTQKYIPYKELFPDATENTALSDEINEVFSLFFQKFDYKILDISVDTANNSATASVKLTTIDAKPLARDFAAEPSVSVASVLSDFASCVVNEFLERRIEAGLF